MSLESLEGGIKYISRENVQAGTQLTLVWEIYAKQIGMRRHDGSYMDIRAEEWIEIAPRTPIIFKERIDSGVVFTKGTGKYFTNDDIAYYG